MADTLTRRERSQRMSLVRASGNKATELFLAVALRRHGLKGWRRKTTVFGKPDFAWMRQRIALFVDGCFWHGCPTHSRIPKSRKEFWIPKLERNRSRDRQVTARLQRAGWSVLRIWECDLRKPTFLRKLQLLEELLHEQRSSGKSKR